jgi:transcriptional regulator with XRE-family HTH domain
LRAAQLSGNHHPVSYTGTTLEHLLQKQKMKANQLAELSGVSNSAISRAISDDIELEFETVIKLANALSSDPEERATLVMARIRDELGTLDEHTLSSLRLGAGAQASMNDLTAKYQAPMSEKMREALIVLLDNAHDPVLSDLLQSLAALFSRGKVVPMPKQPPSPVSYLKTKPKK